MLRALCLSLLEESFRAIMQSFSFYIGLVTKHHFTEGVNALKGLSDDICDNNDNDYTVPLNVQRGLNCMQIQYKRSIYSSISMQSID